MLLTWLSKHGRDPLLRFEFRDVKDETCFVVANMSSSKVDVCRLRPGKNRQTVKHQKFSRLRPGDQVQAENCIIDVVAVHDDTWAQIRVAENDSMNFVCLVCHRGSDYWLAASYKKVDKIVRKLREKGRYPKC